MSMDRESRLANYVMKEGVKSPLISTARAAWQSAHFSSEIIASTITYEVLNESTSTNGSPKFVAAVDCEGAVIPPVAVTPGMVLPVNISVNHARSYRLVFSTAQAAGATFSVVNKT